MKGRPSGTPKSDDPNKKKRKRVARERDLCDVKIKVTEYFPGAQIPADDDSAGAAAAAVQAAGFGGEKFWTVQRVNGNGGNGKGDGVAGPHKHTLERSDEIKKNTVQRLLAKKEKETRKQQVSWMVWRSEIKRGADLAGTETCKQESFRGGFGDDQEACKRQRYEALRGLFLVSRNTCSSMIAQLTRPFQPVLAASLDRARDKRPALSVLRDRSLQEARTDAAS
jgi:hypothetical protein